MAVDQITVTGEGHSFTVTDAQFTQTLRQLDLPFPADKADCAEFLGQMLTIEDEMDRLRGDIQGLVEFYKKRLPLRAVRCAIKVVRARQKLAEHPKEPMGYAQQAQLEEFVQEHIAALDAEKHAAAQAGVDMTSGEVRV